MGLNREKMFPSAAQRELQDAADALGLAAQKLEYATRKATLDFMQVTRLTSELEVAKKAFDKLFQRMSIADAMKEMV